VTFSNQDLVGSAGLLRLFALPFAAEHNGGILLEKY
jgi:hypothetical protein